MTQLKKVSFPFASNDRDHPKHEPALERFGSVIDLNRMGSMMLAEMLNSATNEPEYVMLGAWTDPKTKETTVIPFGKLFVHPSETPVYAFPDGEGGYNKTREDSDGPDEATDDRQPA